MTDVSDSLHFSDAYAVVAQEIGKARQQVVCGLAGPCARPLFDLLLACSRKGVLLSLVVPGEFQDQAPGIAWERLTALGAQLHRLRTAAPRLHTSVCVVDGVRVMSGELECLQVLPDAKSIGVLLQADTDLAQDCARGLGQWAATHAVAQAPVTPQDTRPDAPPESTDLAAYDDPTQWTLGWQTALLQAHALALQADLSEMHRTLNAFDRAQDAAIGPLLRECLDAKRKHLHALHAQSGTQKARIEAQEAQENFDRYTQAQDAKPAPAPTLEPAAQAQMKQLYRKLAMRLHPDRVEDEQKTEAQALFQRLQAGYENNDLAALQTLEQQVLRPHQAGAAPSAAAGEPPNKRRPVQHATALKDRLAQYQRDREAILRSATWQTLSTQSNWTMWFSQQASYLQAELQRYARALSATSPP